MRSIYNRKQLLQNLKSQHRSLVVSEAVPASKSSFRICVLGAGVIGLTSALRLKKAFKNAIVTVVAEKFGSDTTTFGAAGLWGPYALSNTSEGKVHQWGKQTYQHLMEVYHTKDASKAGLSIVPCYAYYKQPTADPFWRDIPVAYSRLPKEYLNFISEEFVDGIQYTSVVVEGRFYLDFLKECLGPDTTFLQRHLKTLNDVEGFDMIINCCGLGARELVPDLIVKPIRGQIIRVKAPWVRASYQSSPYYIIPNRDFVILGGTTQEENWSLFCDLEDKEKIWEGCCSLLPSLRQAEFVSDWVGLRPGRSQLRLEPEELVVSGKRTLVIHNYGHGGAGLTLAWGCASDVVGLAQEYLDH